MQSPKKSSRPICSLVYGSFSTSFDPSHVKVADLYGSPNSFSSLNRTSDASTGIHANSALESADDNNRSQDHDPTSKADSSDTQVGSASNLNSSPQSMSGFQPIRRKGFGHTRCLSPFHLRLACKNRVKCRRCLTSGHIEEFCKLKR